MTNFIGIIPARYGSTRLKGKVLLDICGKSVIQRVYERSTQALSQVYVATDDERIAAHANSFGAEAIMTSTKHHSGTDRCLEALELISKTHPTPIDVVINIQGDEPLVIPEQIADLKKCFQDKKTDFATLAVAVTNTEDLENNSEVFVTFDIHYNALYFSRSIIPYVLGANRSEWMKKTTFYKHLGFYAYTKAALKKFASLPITHLEKIELLEQNRWVAHGNKIKIGITKYDTVGVDTIEDLEYVRKILSA